MSGSRRRAASVAAAAFCAGAAVLYHHAAAQAGRAETPVKSLEAQDIHDVFTPGGRNRETHQARIFIITKGSAGGVIEDFQAGGSDKLRIAGFGLTKPEAAKALMHQQGEDVILQLPGGPAIKLLKTSLGLIGPDQFQLELDRSNLKQTFADDFNSFSWYSEGMSPRQDRSGTWRTHYGYQGINQEGSRTLPGEAQIYADPAFTGTSSSSLGLNPFHVANGILEIRAERAPEKVLPYIWGRKYTSGIITSRFSFYQRYGLFEIRARLPAGRGFWPAFWLLPVDGSWPPEIDVFEVLGRETTKLYASTHSQASGEHTATSIVMPVPDVSENFHNFAVDWQKDFIRWYFDGVEIGRVATPADMHKPMFLLANLGMGGDWAGLPDRSTRFPGIFAIDWIRAYQRAL